MVYLVFESWGTKAEIFEITPHILIAIMTSYRENWNSVMTNDEQVRSQKNADRIGFDGIKRQRATEIPWLSL